MRLAAFVAFVAVAAVVAFVAVAAVVALVAVAAFRANIAYGVLLTAWRGASGVYAPPPVCRTRTSR